MNSTPNFTNPSSNESGHRQAGERRHADITPNVATDLVTIFSLPSKLSLGLIISAATVVVELRVTPTED